MRLDCVVARLLMVEVSSEFVSLRRALVSAMSPNASTICVREAFPAGEDMLISM